MMPKDIVKSDKLSQPTESCDIMYDHVTSLFKVLLHQSQSHPAAHLLRAGHPLDAVTSRN